MISRFVTLDNGRSVLSKGEHFSYREISSGDTCLIPSSQEMIVTLPFVVDGELQIDGQLTLDEFFDSSQVPENFSYQTVTGLVRVPSGQQMIVADALYIEGHLQVDGEVLIEDFFLQEEYIDVDVVYPENFSFRHVTAVTEIPVAQQMIVTDGILVDGELRVEGELILDELEETDNYGQQKVYSITKIPYGQQMVLDGGVEIDGTLILDGELSLLGEVEDDFIPWYEIPDKKVIHIKEKREYFLSEYLALEGIIEVEGRLVIGA